MQAIRNKIDKHRSKRLSQKYTDPKLVEERTEKVTTRDADGAVLNETVHKTVVETPLVDSSIPVPPPMPPTDFYLRGSQNDYDTFFTEIPTPPPMPSTDFYLLGSRNDYDRFFTEDYLLTPVSMSGSRTFEALPIQVLEKPAVVHESIRMEEIEEIQPIIQIDREKTEIRQITQPLTDKEIKPVTIEQRILPNEVLPIIYNESTSTRLATEESTVVEESTRRTVEKAPIIEETEKWHVIEEIQPIIYRTVIVPHVVRSTARYEEVHVAPPSYFSHNYGYNHRGLSAFEMDRYSTFARESYRPRQETRSLRATDFSSASSLPIRTEMRETTPSKVLATETITTTVSSETVAPISAAPLRSTGLATMSAPVVIEKKHLESRGLHGEKITKDITTLQQSSVRPTMAI